MISEICVSAHNRIFPDGRFPNCSRNPPKDPSNKIPYRASEPSPSTVGAPLFQPEWFTFAQKNNNSRSDKSAEQRDLHQPMAQTTDRLLITRAQRRTRT
jgi:hypothetical protein